MKFQVMFRSAFCRPCSMLWEEHQLHDFTNKTAEILSATENLDGNFLDRSCPRCEGPVYPAQDSRQGKGSGKSRKKKAEPDVYNAEEAWQAGMEGLARAESATTPEEWSRMMEAIRAVARESPVVTSDLVWKKLGGTGTIKHKSALGGALIRAHKLGVLGGVIDTDFSERKVGHKRHMRIWSRDNPEATDKE